MSTGTWKVKLEQQYVSFQIYMQITKCNWDLNLVLNPGLKISVLLKIFDRNKLTERKNGKENEKWDTWNIHAADLECITVITDLTSHSYCVLNWAWQRRRLWWQSCSLSCWAGWSKELRRRGWRGNNAVEISRGWKSVDVGAHVHSVSSVPEAKTSHVHCKRWQALHQTTAVLPEYVQTDANIPLSLLKPGSLNTRKGFPRQTTTVTLRPIRSLMVPSTKLGHIDNNDNRLLKY